MDPKTLNQLTEKEINAAIAIKTGWTNTYSKAKGEFRWYEPAPNHGSPHNYLNPPDFLANIKSPPPTKLRPPRDKKVSKKDIATICKLIDQHLPKKHGFILFAFPTADTPGLLRYASNTHRKEAVNLIKEWMIQRGYDENWMRHID